jgi:Mn2+/Fe2+ NRAMP family transporter
MSTAQGSPPEHLPDASAAGAPRTWRGRLAYLGPGLVLAAASVGAGDMVTSLSGAADYGMALMWAILIGVTIKFALTEAIGRLYMATGRTVIASLGSVSKVLPVVFFVFVFVIGLLYGAALSSVAALALSTLVPALPLKPLAIVITLVATGIVLLGRYAIFERVMIVFTLVKFSGMVVLAIIMLASTDDLPRFLSSMRPGLPEGSVLTVLALIGGVGGTAGVAAYGYWVREKGWQHRSWLPVMRADAAISYGITFLFVFCTSIVGTGLLFGTGRTITGNDGLAALADPLASSLGAVAATLFLLTFFFVTLSALVGGFNAIAYMLADSLRTLRSVPDSEADTYVGEKSRPFRCFVLFCAVSSISVVFAGKPVALVLTYAAVGSLILPILSGGLLLLLNRREIDTTYRNKITSNAFLSSALVLFGILAVVQLTESF